MPRDHPLRRIKAVADAALAPLSPTFDRMYTQADRTSVPPEQLLKALPLIALYKGRSEHASNEEFEYNLPCRWCLDMDLLAHDAGRPYLTRRYGRATKRGCRMRTSVWTGPERSGRQPRSFRPKKAPPHPSTDDDPGYLVIPAHNPVRMANLTAVPETAVVSPK